MTNTGKNGNSRRKYLNWITDKTTALQLHGDWFTLLARSSLPVARELSWSSTMKPTRTASKRVTTDDSCNSHWNCVDRLNIGNLLKSWCNGRDIPPFSNHSVNLFLVDQHSKQQNKSTNSRKVAREVYYSRNSQMQASMVYVFGCELMLEAVEAQWSKVMNPHSRQHGRVQFLMRLVNDISKRVTGDITNGICTKSFHLSTLQLDVAKPSEADLQSKMLKFTVSVR